jgi:uncharacterized membrane protein YfcA
MTDPGVYLAGLSIWALAYALAAVFLAALVRGYSGFGLSALIVTSLTLVVPPAEVVPVAMFLEVAASAGMVRLVWRDVNWPATRLLLATACLGTPLGVLLLTALSADVMRVVISLIVLGTSLALWFGLRVRALPGRGTILGTGLVSGVANGSAAVGGLPLVLYFLSVSANARSLRATMMIYLMFLSGFGLAVAAWSGLVTFEVLLRGAILCLPLAFGLALGHRRFLRASPDSFRRFALGLLVVLSLLGLLRAARA